MTHVYVLICLKRERVDPMLRSSNFLTHLYSFECMIAIVTGTPQLLFHWETFMTKPRGFEGKKENFYVVSSLRLSWNNKMNADAMLKIILSSSTL